jgi:ABC-type transport system involved in multi-copper enzyme maturation permease subunit
MRKVWLIAKTILIEAVRRRDIYVVALISAALILFVGTFRFFGVSGLHKFFREVALTVMNWATMIIVILLAARQLPREFETRQIYPLLAKPISRLHFLAGKLLGTLLAAAIAYAVFMLAFFIGQWQVGVPLKWGTFLQMIYLRFMALAIIGSLTLMFSTLMTHSATVTVAFLFFVFSEQITAFLRIYYLDAGDVVQRLLIVLNYVIPQLALADLTTKVVHDWDPVPAWVLGFWTIDAAIFVAVFFAISFLRFRKREI